MVGPTPRYARCRISGEQVQDGSYGCVLDNEQFDEIMDPFREIDQFCSCKLGECKAPGQQPG